MKNELGIPTGDDLFLDDDRRSRSPRRSDDADELFDALASKKGDHRDDRASKTKKERGR